MAKPDWLKENEKDRPKVEDTAKKCVDCAYFGRPVKETRHKGKEKCMVHECDIHPGCMNTRFSLACEDLLAMLP